MMDRERHEDVKYADDIVSGGLITRIIVITIVLTLSLCVLAYLLMRAREQQLRPSMRFPEKHLGPPREVAGLRQTVYDLPQPRPELKQQQRAALERFGWADRERREVHMPIERAFDVLLRRRAGSEGQPR
jgi:hypothetical protein